MRRMFPMMLVRIIVGLVFVTEGALKFIFPDELGVGRFAHIGFISPSVLSPFVGGVEIAAGAAVLVNLYAGDAALLLLAVIVMAIVSTKVPILLGRPWGPFRSGVEIAAGAAVLVNLYAGDAALLLLAVIVMAIVSTKVPILLGRPWGPFRLAKN